METAAQSEPPGLSTLKPGGLKVGVIGVGAMGGAMAARLSERGCTVWVHDRDPSRVAAAVAEGALAATDAADLSRRASVVIVVVTDAAEAAAALLDGETVPSGGDMAARPAFGVAHGLSGRAVLLCPTIAPRSVEGLAARLAERGVALLEAPMSGGPRRAREGSMSLMVAGDPVLRQQLAGLLAALSDQVVDLGPRLGDGARMKLVNNLLAATHLAAAAEALALAERVGLAPAQVLDVAGRSSGQSWIADDRGARWLAHRMEGNLERGPLTAASALSSGAEPTGPVGLSVQARIALLAKDSALAREMAGAAGVDLPVTSGAIEAFAQAAAAGWDALDDAHLIDYRAGRPMPSVPPFPVVPANPPAGPPQAAEPDA